MKLEIMTPDNKRWQEFIEKLEGPEGCNFKEKVKGYPQSITWQCSSKKDRHFTTSILNKMGNIDVKKSLKYFDKHGGNCDCEILFNVDR